MIRFNSRATLGTAALIASLAAAAGPAAAQSQAGCKPDPASSGPALTLDCGFGLKITVERTAVYRVVDGDGDGRAEGLRLDRGGALVSYDRNAAGGAGFQIITPRAVASVRGTEWAVDAAAKATSVFVLSGRVAVTPQGGGAGVVLHSGEGVDVSGPGPQRAIRWGQARVAALLARFGR